MLVPNIWHPSTCGCVITFVYDDALPREQQTHIAFHVEPCEAHKDIGDNHKIYKAVTIENQTINQVHGAMIEMFPEHTQTIIERDGSFSMDLKSEQIPSYDFGDADEHGVRAVHVKTALEEGKRNRLRSAFADKIKPNKTTAHDEYVNPNAVHISKVVIE